MRKKIIVITFMMLLIANVIPTMGLIKEDQEYKSYLIGLNEVCSSNNDDYMDQKQTIHDSEVSITEVGYGQSFEPLYHTLTRVRVKLIRNGAPPYSKYTLTLRAWNMTGYLRNIADIKDPVKDIPLGASWVEFKFDRYEDGLVNNKYYLHLCASGPTGSPGDIKWCYGNDDPYIYGDAWYHKGNWIIFQEGLGSDFCFMTFGFGQLNYPPEKPIVTGPPDGVVGEEYEFYVSLLDNDFDHIYMKVNYGDGEVTGWDFGPQPWNCTDGREVPINHYYEKDGIYEIRIKAKDEHDYESEWSDPLTIIMPKSKAININLFLQRFFQRFTFFEKILNQII